MSDDESWIFDSLIWYLGGPIWNLPILNFIENKSIFFEDGRGKDEDYHKIHEEYKNLVDFMLVTYMEDIGLTPEQFEAVCGKISVNMADSSYKLMFEQVWAADDFEVFKKMMVQKNLELQLQVLELLQRLHGIIPDSLKFDESLPPDERAVINEAYKNSIEEHQSRHSGDAGNASCELSIDISHAQEEKERITEEKNRLLESGMKSTDPPKSQIDPDDLRKRQEHFRLHRDKLLELKKKEREKLLHKYEQENSGAQARPKSSKAAQKMIKGAHAGPQTLQVRHALLEKIKKEVIDKK